MRNIVFDIETKNTFRDVGSRHAADLDISVLAIYDSKTNEYSSFLEEEFGDLWPIIESADSLIGYNSNHFDIPLLNKYYHGDLTQIKSIDLLEAIYESLGRRIKLDDVAKATLGEEKSGHGLQAVTWWKQGEIDKIREYCIQDVRVTKNIYDYALENGHLKYNQGKEIQEIPIDTTDWEKKESTGMTHSMPF
ncbi:MAG: ribonuclease H-like domain-containing protein [Candidatus Paceibacterota bacterium]